MGGPAHPSAGDEGTTWRRAGPFASRCIAGETILVPIRGDVAQLESVFTLNPVAAAIWEVLERPSDEEALVAHVVNAFEIGVPAARADVRVFLRTLREEGLVVPAGERP